MKARKLTAVFLAVTMAWGCAPASVWARAAEENGAVIVQETSLEEGAEAKLEEQPEEQQVIDEDPVSEWDEAAEERDAASVQETSPEEGTEPEAEEQQVIDEDPEEVTAESVPVSEKETGDSEEEPIIQQSDNQEESGISEDTNLNNDQESDEMEEAAEESEEFLEQDGLEKSGAQAEDEEAEKVWTVHVYAPGVEGYQDGELYSEFTVEDGKFFSMTTYGDLENVDPHFYHAGWALDPDGNEVIDSECYYPNSDIDIYPLWKEAYVVTLDADGGTFEFTGTGTWDWSIVPGECCWIGRPVTVNKDGKAFAGWYTDEACTEDNLVTNLWDFYPQGDCTVKAKWVDGLTLTLNFGRNSSGEDITCNINGSSEKEVEYCIAEGAPIEDLLWTFQPHRDDDEFYCGGGSGASWELAGWSLEDGGDAVDASSFSISEDTTLYAVWERYCHVYYEPVEGYFPGWEVGYSMHTSYPYGSRLYEYARGETPVIEDTQLKFAGWFLDEERTEPLTKDYEITDVMVSLYAGWEERGPIIAEELTLDEVKNVSSQSGEMLLSFTPDHEGRYKVYSFDNGDTDPYVKLYDNQLVEIAADDDSSGNGNFALTWQLEEGQTYYFGVCDKTSDDFSYSVLLQEIEITKVIAHTNNEEAWFEIWNGMGEPESADTLQVEIESGNEVNGAYSMEWDSAHWIFMGWADSPEAEEAETVIAAGDTMEVWAVWKKVCTVIFHANHENAYYSEWTEEGEQRKDSFQEQYEGGSRIWSDYEPNYDDSQLSFEGWSTDPDADVCDEEIIVSESLTDLYAVWKEASTVTLKDKTATYTGNTINIDAATVTGTSGKVTYTYYSDKDCTKIVTAHANAGTYYVKATAAADTKYMAATSEVAKLVINKAAQSVTAKAGAASVAVGKTTKITVTGASGTKSFKSANTAIATVNSSGLITAKKVGTVKITVTSAATENYKAQAVTVTIKVVPAAASSVSAVNQATGIKVSWSGVAGASGFYVYRNGTLIKKITSGSTRAYVDAKANTNGTKYVYKVVAKAATGVSTLSKSLATYRVARPAITSLMNTASKKMTVKWGKNAKASGYQIQYSLKSNFAGAKTVTAAKAATVSKVIGSLTKGKTYYVRIRTYKTVGKTKYYSLWSVAKKVEISK